MQLDKKYPNDTRNWYNGIGVYMSLDKIHQLVGNLAKAVEADQRLATPLLAVKLAKCASAYPQDKTLGSMSRIIGDMVGHNTTFIRRADFKSLYHKMYTHNTKFAELFQEELGETAADLPTHSSNGTIFQRDDGVKANPYHVGDQILANALESAFDSQLPLKMYSQPLAEKAMRSVGTTLDVWNLRPTRLVISDGNDKFIVIKADYETPKGLTSFYVPVEVVKNDVVNPEVFMGNTGPEDLNHTTIKAYLTQQAGTTTKVGAKDILSALTSAASSKREVSAAELALTRLNATRQGKSEFAGSPDLWLGLQVEAAPKKDVAVLKEDIFSSFEQQMSTPKGQADFQFGADKVTVGRTHITRELQSFGFNNPQVVVTRTDNETIFYGVSLDTGKTAFTVPVKITKGKLTKPTVLLCNGSLASFDKTGINGLVSENKIDTKVAAVASILSTLKPSEVVNNLRQALADGNHAKAEDALNVLAMSGDKRAYETAFQIYMSGMAGVKTAETKCTHATKTANKAVSEYPICSQTGLSTNKVYQDKDGNCRPLYRKGMDETYEGAAFINAKIFG